ncbi:MAG: asparagine synthase (glutamine-hydrolyzing) [Planctomycetota bacterium]|jgi:asparagine synthase (glutamine-hydrolysing)
MCGICGIYNCEEGNSVSKSLLDKMTAAIAHRGPDDEGFYVKDGVGLGHRRLSIIDVESGHQPLSNEDETVWIVYNGEIYNFKEIQKDLVARGHRFRTRTDTEVIVHAYEEWGTDCVRIFNGIFAFAIWDERQRKLFLARDQFGVKPLYYYYDGKRFLFGSELKTILSDSSIRREIDIDALNLCLTFRHTPSPFTLLKGIRKLPPGHFMEVSEAGIREKQYWDYQPEIDNSRKEKDWIADLRDLFEKAIIRQMISDVPIGISLSGGVDSGAILGVMAAHMDRPVHAFTVGFEGAERTNEIEHAKATARLFGADFCEQTVMQKDYMDFFERYIWYLEEPIGNLSAMAYYFVAKLAYGNVKVLLNGQGADEPFAGYPRHAAVSYSEILSKIPQFLQNRIVQLLGCFPIGKDSLKRAAFAFATYNRSQFFMNTYTIATPEMKKHLYNPEVAKLINMNRPLEYVEKQLKKAPIGTPLEQMTFIDTRTSLPDNLLLCEDKMSMATSIEARVPYLDIELMKLIERIPGNLKIKWLRQKYIHKRASEKWLPKEIVYRKKQGFTNPMDIWLNSKLGSFLTDLITSSDSVTNLFFDRQYIQNLQRLHMEQKEDYRWFLFLLLSIEMWHRIFIRGKSL